MNLTEFVKMSKSDRVSYLKSFNITNDEFDRLRNADIFGKLGLTLDKGWTEGYSRRAIKHSITYNRIFELLSSTYKVPVMIYVSIYKSGKSIESHVSLEGLHRNLVEKGKYYCSIGNENEVELFSTKIGIEKPSWNQGKQVMYHLSNDINDSFVKVLSEIEKACNERKPAFDLLNDPKYPKRQHIQQIIEKYGLGGNQIIGGALGLDNIFDSFFIDYYVKLNSPSLEDWVIMANLIPILRRSDSEWIFDFLEKNDIEVPDLDSDADKDEFISKVYKHISSLKVKLSEIGNYDIRLKDARNEMTKRIKDYVKTLKTSISKKYNVKSKDLGYISIF